MVLCSPSLLGKWHQHATTHTNITPPPQFYVKVRTMALSHSAIQPPDTPVLSGVTTPSNLTKHTNTHTRPSQEQNRKTEVDVAKTKRKEGVRTSTHTHIHTFPPYLFLMHRTDWKRHTKYTHDNCSMREDTFYTAWSVSGGKKREERGSTWEWWGVPT